MTTLRTWLCFATVLSIPLVPQTLPGQDTWLEARVLATADGDVEIRNSKLQGPYNFAVQGGSAVFIGDHNGETHVYKDNQPGPGYEDIQWLAARGSNVAYAAQVGESWQVVTSAGEGPKFEEVNHVQLNAKGSPVYQARNGKQWVVMTGKKPGPAFDAVERLKVSGNGKTTAYAGQKNFKWQMVVNGRSGSPFDSIRTGPVFSRDGKKVAYGAAVRQSKLRVVQRVFIGKKTVGEHAGVDRVAFMPDGKSVCYVATHGNREFPVVGKKKYKRYAWASAPRPTTSGMVAYVGMKGSSLELLNDDKTIATHDLVGRVAPDMLNVSADGSSYAYIAYDEDTDQALVVQDGKKQDGWTEIYRQLWFAPVTNQVAYIAGDDDEVFVVAGDKRSERFNDVLPELRFSDDGKKVAFCAREQRKVRWVVMDL